MLLRLVTSACALCATVFNVTKNSPGSQSQALSRAVRFILSISLAFPVWGVEAPAIEWIRQFGTIDGSNDLARAIAVDGGGNVYVAGQVLGALPGQTSAGGADVFLRKYDFLGNEIWSLQFGTSGNDVALAVAVSGSSVYVGGAVRGALPGFSFAGIEDAFVRKYDAAGNLIWSDQFGSVAGDQVLGIAVDASVSPTAVYVTGLTQAALPGQIGKGETDAFIRKYEDLGSMDAVAWTHQFGTAGIDSGFGIAVDPSGIYVAGRTDADLDGSGPETFKGFSDAFVQKYDGGGSMVWTRQFGTPAVDIAFGVAVDPSGVYVTGRTDADLDGAGPEIHAGSQDSFVRSYDPSGTFLWMRQFGTSAIDLALAVSVDPGGIHITGRTDGDFAGPGALTGVSDAFLQTLDAGGNLLWTRQFGSLGFDQAFAVSGDGFALHIAGHADGALSGETAENVGNTDAFLQRYDGSGNNLWTRRFGTLGPVADKATAVARALDEGGNLYVAGETRGVFPGQTSAGLSDAFLRKYDRSGNEVWTRQFGSPLNDFAPALSIGSGRICVGGRSDAALPGQTFIGGLSDAYIRCFSSGGAHIWTRQFGTVASDTVSAVAVDSRGAVYVAGETEGALPTQTSAGLRDAFIRKYDRSGNEVWSRQFGTSNSEFASGLAVDSRGDVYIAGRTFGTFPGQPVAGVADAFIRKYDSGGNEVWTRQFGSTSIDSANAVTAGPLGEVYVVGQVGGALLGQTYVGGVSDAFLRKYDRNGSELWTRQFGTALADDARSVIVDAAGDVYLAGDVGGTLPGQTGAGDQDAFIRKYNSGGNEVWTIQFGSSQRDSIGGVSASNSEVVVAGGTDGTLPGQTSAGDVDGFVVKFIEVRF
jgi:beta-propeller repeat-containing protein